MPNEYVDLIYLDPPFNSKRSYNLMYSTMTGRPVPEQVEAFCDTWTMDAEKEHIVRNMPITLEKSGVDNMFIQFWEHWIKALRKTQPSLLAYLVYMTVRLAEMRRILKSTGSIYLHCDPTASHYIKVVMDGIFGHNNFRNEIVWKRTSAHNDAKRWGAIHDIVLFYTKGKIYTWNKVYTEYDKDYIKKFYKHRDEKGLFALDNMANPDAKGYRYKYKGYQYPKNGWQCPIETMKKRDEEGLIYFPDSKEKRLRFKRYLSTQKGVPIQDIILDIKPLQGSSKQSLGYPTQKPIALLDRIIKASCPENGIVFDPFCGCGTTIVAAHLNQKRWIGCDIAILSVKLIQEVLKERYSLLDKRDYETDGIPTSIEGAKILFKQDPFQFQHWCIEYVGGFCNNKKTADKGIDGRIYFDGEAKKLESMIISVKGGKPRPSDIRDLRGTLERDQTAMAGFILFVYKSLRKQ